jgi:hypothetical protein
MSTNEELRALVDGHGLKYRDVARLTETGILTVKSWLRPQHSSAFRRMPQRTLSLLRLRLDLERLAGAGPPLVAAHKPRAA